MPCQNLRDIEQRRNEIIKERAAAEKKEAEDKAAHAKTVQAELDRINGLENDKAMSRKVVRRGNLRDQRKLTGQVNAVKLTPRAMTNSSC